MDKREDVVKTKQNGEDRVNFRDMVRVSDSLVIS